MASVEQDNRQPAADDPLAARKNRALWAAHGRRMKINLFPETIAMLHRTFGVAAAFVICIAALALASSGLAQTGAATTSDETSQPQIAQVQSYGASSSVCRELPDWMPTKRLLLFPAQTGADDQARFIAFTESLRSYFKADIRVVAPSGYTSRLLAGVDGIVVFGNGTFAQKDQLRQALLDAKSSAVPIAWVGLGAESFAGELGLRFMASVPAPNAVQVPKIEYNGVTMPTNGLTFARFLAPDPTGAETTLATAMTPGGDPVRVSFARPAEFAYVGYLPFYGNNSRLSFVAAIDTVSRLFGRRDPDRRVLFRLEDINAKTYGPDDTVFAEVTDFLLGRNVFMHLGIIPETVDQNPEAAQERVEMDIGAAINVVRLVVEHPDAVEIVQHGLRHYRIDARNDACSTPGCGSEFFLDDDETMGAEAAAEFARERMLAGQQVLSRHLRAPMVFEAPHYIMSPAQTAVAEKLYPLILHAPWIYGEQSGDFFLPWFTRRNGVFYGPSDVGYVAYDDPLSVERILANLEDLAQVLPDPVVTVFFHSFMRNAEGREGDLERLVTGIETLGYRFASACGELALRN